MVEFILAHIILEMLFYNVLLQRIDPQAKYTMGLDMWLHHAAVALGGAPGRGGPPSPKRRRAAFCL